MHNYISKIILLILSISLFSCDLLTTRDAEKPEISRTLNLPATTADQLFINLRNSFLEKVVKDYKNCFVDSAFTKIPYVFTASSEANFKYPVFADWDLESEENYFNNVISSIGDKGNIILTLKLSDKSIDGTSQSHSYEYSITLSFIDENTPQVYEGIAFFKAVLDDNKQWVIAEWNDTEKSDKPTWSDLKGRF